MNRHDIVVVINIDPLWAYPQRLCLVPVDNQQQKDRKGNSDPKRAVSGIDNLNLYLTLCCFVTTALAARSQTFHSQTKALASL